MNNIRTNIAILGGGLAGYVPTKSFLRNAEVTHLVQKSKEYGINSKFEQADWTSAWSRKEAF